MYRFSFIRKWGFWTPLNSKNPCYHLGVLTGSTIFKTATYLKNVTVAIHSSQRSRVLISDATLAG